MSNIDSESLSKELGFSEFKDIPQNKDFQYWINFSKIQLTITQLFAKRLISPDSSICRILLKMYTGTGKTLTALEIGDTYSKLFDQYHKIYKYDISKNIIIVGFSKSVFKREFMKFPELGFITWEEKRELTEISKSISNSQGETRNILTQQKRLLANKIKKRITTRSSGGYYKFFGYKQLFTNLILTPIDTTKVTSSNIYELFKKGEIKVDMTLMELFKDSLVICDEIHQAYNSTDINNYGLAIQLILDYHRENVMAAYLSATNINNNKRELIDLANLIKDPKTKHFESEEYFYSDQSKRSTKKSIDPIIQEFKGKVIFLEESTSDYPTLKYMSDCGVNGQSIPCNSLTKYVSEIFNKDVDNEQIIFSEAELSPLHMNTTKKHGLDGPDASTQNTIIFDTVIPNPDFSADDILKWNPDHPNFKSRNMDVTGLFHQTEIKEKITNAPEAWRNKIGIKITQFNDYFELSGSWLKKENLKIYSNKAVHFLNILEERNKRDYKYKSLIYHPYVRGSGIITIGNILSENGYVEYGNQPNSDTLSADEPITKKEWEKKYKNKPFRPATYFVLRYEVTNDKRQTIIDLFNSEANKYGSIIKFFVGSQKIKQSVDFKDIQSQIVYSVPTNISELIQIIGRSVRNQSLARLEPHQRVVELHLLVSTMKKGLFMESNRYVRKLLEYDEIRRIENKINKLAINNYIYGRKAFKSISPLGALSFNIKLHNTKASSNMYFADNNHEYIMDLIQMIIKRAFMSNPIWTYKQLWEFFINDRSLNIKVESDPIYRDMFDSVLYSLVYKKEKDNIWMDTDLFDGQNKYFDYYYLNSKMVKSIRRIIVRIKDHYILTPIDYKGNIELNQYSFLKKTRESRYIRHKIDPDSNIDKAVSEIKKYHTLNKSEQEVANYTFLLKFSAEEHYDILQAHIEGEIKIPDGIFNVYKLLNLAGKNWYVDKYKLNKLESGEWNQYNRHEYSMDENNVVVGIINKSFKLRKPKDTEVSDMRKLQSGMNCNSYKKDDLERIIKEFKLNIKPEESSVAICELLLIHMIGLEIMSRSSETSVRYVYTYDEI